ncbi:MAG: hypothetical protein Greene041619_97 [Candidatus Peregrinibacteria bacterium Greene0416_19]|nr:MAG: hypothetical protein Greene041619_97 [Candidatus Peregrinibacteria bacterium Greene0416_19]
MNIFHRFLRMLRLYRKLVRDPRTPAFAKILPWLSILYILWPIDIIPDILPLLGQIDDVMIILLLIYIAIQMVPKGVRDQADKNIIDVEPVKK